MTWKGGENQYSDEHGRIISETELRASYNQLRANGETDCETFTEYRTECLGKNGTLTFRGRW